MTDSTGQSEQPNNLDPRSSLAQWANQSEEWVRRIVRLVLQSNGDIPSNEQPLVYQLFLEEKGLETRHLPEEPLAVGSSIVSGIPKSFALTHLSRVRGVNALVETARIDFAPSLTLLFGENATGKTGYARILKALAGSRSADTILPDVNESSPTPTFAEIGYRIGEDGFTYEWTGEQAQQPFTSISVFDSPSVHFHTDSEVGFVFRPSSLALFDSVTRAVQDIRGRVDMELSALQLDRSTLLARFDKLSSIYPFIQNLGASTNLSELQSHGSLPVNAHERKAELEQTLATLVAGTSGQQLVFLEGLHKALVEAIAYTMQVQKTNIREYNLILGRLSEAKGNQVLLRDHLFAAADLAAAPEQTWEAFVSAGLNYQRYLEGIDSHDSSRCLYCRQSLSHDAALLISTYRDYLESQIAGDIQQYESQLKGLAMPLQENSLAAVESYLTNLGDDEHGAVPVRPEQVTALRNLTQMGQEFQKDLINGLPLNEARSVDLASQWTAFEPWQAEVLEAMEVVRSEVAERDGAITSLEAELLELKDRIELERSWAEIEKHVEKALRAKKLQAERTRIATLLRSVTLLANEASEQMTNKNFRELFENECVELRAPTLHLEFFGREGQAQRRRKLPTEHKPSSVLSEGEQKVVAIADFIAECRMSDQSVPAVFDDPVSSLDHRRVKEVASRIAKLASTHQVIVFTHDIFFTTSLLAQFEGSSGCTYYQVTDEDGKGTVAHATGPRWDTIAEVNKRISASIEKASKASGDERNHFVREGYSWLRNWCEVFVEHDVLAQVTERFQPNVRMTALSKIKISKLEDTFAIVLSVFEDACRYIEGHSQPLPSLGVGPTLANLKDDWEKVKRCRSEYNKASS